MTDGILVCTPMYGGLCTKAYFNSIMQLIEEWQKAGFSYQIATGSNESLITRARNEMTRTFLQETDFSHQLWIDADMEFEPEAVGKLWNLQTDVAVGLYSMKRPDFPLSAWRNGKLVKLNECPREPFEVEYAGTGFMMLSRAAVEKMAAHSESYEGPHGRVPAIYMTPITNDCFESEDYFMCRRWRELGGKIIADPGIKLGHIGQARYGA